MRVRVALSLLLAVTVGTAEAGFKYSGTATRVFWSRQVVSGSPKFLLQAGWRAEKDYCHPEVLVWCVARGSKRLRSMIKLRCPRHQALFPRILKSPDQPDQMLTTKRGLHHWLRQAKSTHIAPLTFSVASPEEWQAFTSAGVLECAHWVYKLSKMSSGRGIEFFSREDPNLLTVANRPDKDAVVQCYLDNPLLLFGKKAELRLYWFVAGVSPLLVYWAEGPVRTTNVDYDPAQFDGNAAAHVINTKQQREQAGEGYQESKLTWLGLERVLSALNLVDHTAPLGGWTNDHLRPQLLQILRQAIRAVQPSLVHAERRFELLGMDALLEAPKGQEGVKAWLTELQTGPGMADSHWVSAMQKPPMVQEMMEMMLHVQAEGVGPPAEQLTVWRQLELLPDRDAESGDRGREL